MVDKVFTKVDHLSFSPLVRSERDQHVLSLQRPSSIFRSICDIATDNASLANVVRAVSPASIEIFAHAPSPRRPSNKILGVLPKEDVQAFSEALSVSAIDAIGNYIRTSDPQCLGSLALLHHAPPKDVHAMQRGPTWVGDFYSADMVIDVLAHCGIEFQTGQTILDYGCSSGSLLRVLAWANPDVRFIGTDPVDKSIQWANQNLVAPNLQFFNQRQVPPLNIGNDSIDIVIAISIFSHHGMNAGMCWFKELARVLRSGGYCLFTCHGLGSILHYIEMNLKGVDRYKELYASLLTSGGLSR